MAKYNLSFLCSDCGRFHQTKTSVAVINGPDRVKRIDAVYRPNERVSRYRAHDIPA